MDVEQLNTALAQVGSIEGQKDNDVNIVVEHQECLGFKLSDEHFCVPILRVEEIRGWELPSLLPDSKCFVKGVINLRGAIVPIIDLRERFLEEPQKFSTSTVVIVLRIFYPNEDDKVVGAVVDSVTDVIKYQPKKMKQVPNMDHSMADGFVEGLIDYDEEVYFKLDIDKLLNIDQF